eukprot:TRINITY_DN17556_c0_g1_i2.p1 TRINITY_DN17556_c0_g1~~TRINITY_DN17556_c0_g1_i2.p1  ORF type:complete len:254 (-),score=44.47 TRINITY_DN17556_c0_g1_i2:31-792(-)
MRLNYEIYWIENLEFGHMVATRFLVTDKSPEMYKGLKQYNPRSNGGPWVIKNNKHYVQKSYRNECGIEKRIDLEFMLELPQDMLESMPSIWMIGLRYPPRSNTQKCGAEVFVQEDPEKHLAVFGLLMLLKYYDREKYRVVVTPKEIESLFQGTKMIDLIEKFELDGKVPDGIEEVLKTFQQALDGISDAISYAIIIKQLYERLSCDQKLLYCLVYKYLHICGEGDNILKCDDFSKGVSCWHLIYQYGDCMYPI